MKLKMVGISLCGSLRGVARFLVNYVTESPGGPGPLTNRETERPTTRERYADLSEREANSLILEHDGIAER
jgi:hypothetical protein